MNAEPNVVSESRSRGDSVGLATYTGYTQHHKKQWWQKNIAKKAATFVRADVEAVTKKSPFLMKSYPNTNPLALFDRSEIKTGRLLGSGGFAVAYEIVAFELDESLSGQMRPEDQAVRQQMVTSAIDPQTGRGRYVIKHLQEELFGRKVDYSVAASDMALEVEYLRHVDHPNIVSLRGLPSKGLDALEDGRHDGYFLILDRLEETLDERITKWKKMKADGLGGPSVPDKVECIKQLATALGYLHQNRIIYRDLKPENVGFNIDGTLQLFDFGLCRELPAGDLDMEDVYEMTGVGTRRYMAPEIINDAHYNAKCDVYSWAMVSWQVFTLEKPYAQYALPEHTNIVCKGGKRPSIRNKKLPQSIKTLLSKAWSQSVACRATIPDVLQDLGNASLDDECECDSFVAPSTEVTCSQLQFGGDFGAIANEETLFEMEAFSVTSTSSSSDEDSESSWDEEEYDSVKPTFTKEVSSSGIGGDSLLSGMVDQSVCSLKLKSFLQGTSASSRKIRVPRTVDFQNDRISALSISAIRLDQ